MNISGNAGLIDKSAARGCRSAPVEEEGQFGNWSIFPFISTRPRNQRWGGGEEGEEGNNKNQRVEWPKVVTY